MRARRHGARRKRASRSSRAFARVRAGLALLLAGGAVAWLATAPRDWPVVAQCPSESGQTRLAHAEARQLVDCGGLVGRSRGEVRAVLGPPSRDANGARWSYNLPDAPLAYLDPRSLVLEFEQGRVRAAAVREG